MFAENVLQIASRAENRTHVSFRHVSDSDTIIRVKVTKYQNGVFSPGVKVDSTTINTFNGFLATLQASEAGMNPELTARRAWRRRSRVHTEAVSEKEADFEGVAERRKGLEKSGERLQPATRPRSGGVPSFVVGEGRREAGERSARGRSRRAEKNHQQL